MTTLVWLIGLFTSIGMLGVIVALVSDENRRHIAFSRPLRAWRPRRRVVVVERHIVPGASTAEPGTESTVTTRER